MDTPEQLTHRLEREKKAREEAESLLEKRGQELYRANQELIAKEKRSRLVLDSAIEGIITTDESGIIESINPAAKRIFGFNKDHPEAIPFSQLVEGRYTARSKYQEELTEPGEPIGTLFHDITGRRLDGSLFPMDLSLSELCLEEKIIQVAIIRDISDRKQEQQERNHMEMELRQAQKLESIGQLAAGIAHEINTPTQFVSDNVRFLQDAFADLTRLIEYWSEAAAGMESNGMPAEIVAGAGELAEEIDLEFLGEEIPNAIGQSLDGLTRVSSIVRSMKEFSHPGNEEKCAANLNKAIESTVDVSRSEWKYDAEVTLELDPGLPEIKCHIGELNQAMLNIIVNSAHAIAEKGGENGSIVITTKVVEEWVEISITDNGCGIPEPDQERIFDPFFTTKQVGKGTGQGLAIAYACIVDRHDGNISIESIVGEGTTFRIRLPIIE